MLLEDPISAQGQATPSNALGVPEVLSQYKQVMLAQVRGIDMAINLPNAMRGA